MSLRAQGWHREILSAGRCGYESFFETFFLFGIAAPIFVFAASLFLAPWSKADADHGWIDRFYVGKLALFPLVVWASAALYAIEVHHVQNRSRPWIVLGISSVATVSTGCLASGYLTTGWISDQMGLFYLVPLYTSIWYILRAVNLYGAAQVKPIAYRVY